MVSKIKASMMTSQSAAAGTVPKADGAGGVTYANVSENPILRVQQTATSGTGGGQRSVAGSWVSLGSKINVEARNTTTGCSLNTSTGVITLVAGSYVFGGWKIFYGTTGSRIRLYNITDSTYIVGSSAYASGSGGPSDSKFTKEAFTISATKTYRIEYWVNGTTGGSFDLGPPVGTGDTEVYADLYFEKVA